ncbi:MAG: phosphatase PAP2 family protein [Deltaproteobacteria bacterium]|nr:phosphatase PAP2 family protein [Deltaproteobacteria bacterium]
MIITVSPSVAGGGDFIDRRVNKDDSGIWQYHYDLPAYLIGATAAGAIWEGNDTRFGKTLWKSADALIISGVVTQALKYSTTRVRPSKTDDPNLWFQGGDNYSFPSGHVSSVAALVTPIILEYRDDRPWVYILAIIPLYEAIGRVNAQAHWQTDVLAGAAIGVAAGYYEQKISSPLIFYVLPEGVYMGLKYRF